MAENMIPSRNNLMCAIRMYSFYIYDLNLFLDSHPNDKRALAKFNEVNRQLKAAVKLYNEKYGPLEANQNLSEEYFYWVDDPWPWERGAN